MTSKPFLAISLLLSVLLTGLGQNPPSSPSKQNQPPPPAPQKSPAPDDKDDSVRITTNLVQVDAVVTKDGKPVNNLKADDFEIFQDGKRQSITSFAYVSNVSGSETSPTPKGPTKEKNAPLPPAATVRADEPHRTIALVVDDLGLSFESMKQVKRQLKKFVDEQIQPNDLIAIIRTGGDVGALQQFTNDKRLLYNAIEKAQWNLCSRVGVSVFRPVLRGPLMSDGSMGACGLGSVGSTIRSLQFILGAMGALPGRKSMIIFTDSLPRQEQEEKIDGISGADESSEADTSSPGPSFRNYSFLLQRLAEIAVRNSIVIYGVDTQGLQYTGPTAADHITGSPREITTQTNSILSSRSALLWSRREGADKLATQTGGFLVRNSNSFKLDQILEDQDGYYLIGYRPTEETFNRRFHHIKARVKRSGFNLRTRFGFYGITEDEARSLQRTRTENTDLALISPFGAHDIAVELTALFTNVKSSGSVLRSFLYLNAKDLTFSEDADGWHNTKVEVRAMIFGNNGVVADQFTHENTLRLRGQTFERALRDGISMQFDMPVKRPGAYQVRVSARDVASSRIGSAGQFVSVPNLNDQRLALSGIVLHAAVAEHAANPAAAIAPKEPSQSAPPATTSEEANSSSLAVRRFLQGSNVVFACAIYNAANEPTSRLPHVTMVARLFHDGTAVYTSPSMPVDTKNQTDLTRMIAKGIVRLQQEMEPGRYFLQLVVSDPFAREKQAEAMQWIDFEIVKP